jgi:glycosyltransferase involved in cell wall biosynthesis
MSVKYESREHAVDDSDTGKRISVSVIVPTYNRAEYLRQALSSVLDQSGVSAEVIVVDDGSTDETPHVVESYSDRVRYVRQTNQGPAAARNHGLRLARGDYVAFLDSDDYYVPGILSKLLAVLAAQPTPGAVQGGFVHVAADGEQLSIEEPWREAPQLDLDTCIRLKPAYLATMMLSREWIERVGGFDTALRQGEDVDLLIRLVAAGCSVEWLPRPVTYHRRHPGNMTHDRVGGAEDIERVLDKYFARTDVPDRLRRDERAMRFYNLVWSAWRISCDGRTEQVTPWLERSLARTPFSPDETVRAWLDLFVEHDALAGRTVLGPAVWLPAIRIASRSLPSAWTDNEALLVWWARVWSHYLEEDTAAATEGLAEYRDLPPRELLALARDSLVLSPKERRVDLVDRFWADVETVGSGARLQRGAVAGLYLTAFGQAVLGGDYGGAKTALRRVARSSLRRGAATAWGRFVRDACKYAARRIAGFAAIARDCRGASEGRDR